MFRGIHEIRTAQVYLADHDLEHGTQYVWKAMFYSEEWPEPLQQQATSLLPLMFKAGPIKDTVCQLTASDCVSLRLRLLAFIDEALRVDGAAAFGILPEPKPCTA